MQKELSKLDIPPISIIKASAGAGKTYELSLHFLRILKSFRNPCAEELRSVVAITFTNKAAAEMKERILFFLKQIALNTELGRELEVETGLSPTEASLWLDIIIDNYSDFCITTIDSLLFSIFRSLAFELNLNPDMKVKFSVEEFVDEAFDHLIMSTDENAYSLLKKAFDTYLTVEGKGGFYPEKSIKKRFSQLYGFLDTSLKNVNLDLKKFLFSKHRLKESYLEFYQAYNSLSNYLNKNKLKSLTYDLSEEKVIQKNFWKNDFESIFKKNMMSKLSPSVLQDFKNIFEKLKDAASCYELELGRFSYYQAIGYVPVLFKLAQEIENIFKRDSISLSMTWTQKIRSYCLEKGLPLVYNYMGTCFFHFLFDEFQDTSRSQWEALIPLFEEALSKGGSLFVVGDIKQAIYRWRGGDWSLFEELKHSFPSASHYIERTLEHNYRSHPELVLFFNKLFSPLSDRDWIKESFSNIAVGRELLLEVREEFAKALYMAFKDHSQRPVREINGDAQIKFIKIKGDNKDKILNILKENLIHSVSSVWELLDKDKENQIAVIVRTNEQARLVSSWLMEAKLPVVTENSMNLWTSSVVRGILCILRLLIDPEDQTAMYGLLSSGIVLNGPRQEKELFNAWHIKDKKIIKWKQDVLDIVLYIRKFISFVSCYELVKMILHLFGIEQRLELGELKEHAVFINKFLEFTYESQIDKGIFLEEFVDLAEKQVMEVQIGLPEKVNAVRVITIHKAKGLEFSNVFIPFTDWKIKNFSPIVVKDGELVCLSSKAEVLSRDIKFSRQMYRAEEAQELLNLFYVAITRAKRGVYCYLFNTTKRGPQPISKWIEELIKKAQLTSFVQHLN